MRSLPAFAGLLAAVHALPQSIDFKAVSDADPVPSVTVPIGAAQATTINYDPQTAYRSVTDSVNQDPPTQTPSATGTVFSKRDACQTQPAGAGPVPSPDNASAFLSYSYFSSAASAAPTPSGYANTFTNLQASNNAYGYMGYTALDKYDSIDCAAKCNAIQGCSAFNIYFERDPSVEPGAGCSDPPSTTVIKCVFWGGPVTKDNAQNTGQWRADFQVVMAGSNGYVNYAKTSVNGYNTPTNLDNVAINAPLDCDGDDTYMGVRVFTDGPFDAGLCASACSATSQWNIDHPPANGKPQTCQFFNTYLLLKNGVSVGQYCAMYSQAWDASYAKNDGQWRGNDHYTITYSYSFVNSTSPGAPRIPCAVASATSAIVSASAQPFCSALLGYTIPLTTSTATNSITVPSATITSTTYSTTSTETFTSTNLVAITTQVNKRGLSRARARTSCSDHDHSFVVRDATAVSDATTTISDIPMTTVYGDGWVDVAPVFTDVPDATNALQRRTISPTTPTALATFPADVLSSACSMEVTPATSTSTVSATVTQTITSGAQTVTTTIGVTTTSTTQTITSTTTISVANGAPTGTVGYLRIVPTVNTNAAYALSDNANHLTDNFYAQGKRETFIVTPESFLYSVTNNAYYFLSSNAATVPSLLNWSTSKNSAQAIFEPQQPAADGSYKVKVKDGNNAYKATCVFKNGQSTDSSLVTFNSAAGFHVVAYSTSQQIVGCVPVDLVISPV